MAVGLLDIAQSTRTVSIGKAEVHVSGVSAAGIAYLLERFPILRQLFAGREVSMNPDQLMKLAPEAIASVVACGTGYVNSPEAEKIAAGLSAGIQLELISTIMEVTMPKGVAPFMESLTGLANSLDASGKAPVGKSPKQSKT